MALAAVQAQQILHVQVLQSVSECTQDGGKVCGKSGGSAEELEPDHLCQAARWPTVEECVVAVRLFHVYFAVIVVWQSVRQGFQRQTIGGNQLDQSINQSIEAAQSQKSTIELDTNRKFT